MGAEKTPAMRPTDASVPRFLADVPGERRREDALRLCAMMQEITGEPPVLWGASIIGFGTYHYRYASGHEGDAALASFSPRRQHLAIYLVGEFGTRHRSALARLGPHTTGKGCLYIKSLDDVDHDALRELIDRSVRVRQGIDRADGARWLGGLGSVPRVVLRDYIARRSGSQDQPAGGVKSTPNTAPRRMPSQERQI